MLHRFKPVTIRDPSTGFMTGVSDVERALELMRGWPVKPKLKAAYVVCAECLDGTKSAEEARKAFVSAAKEAATCREG